MAAVPVPSGTVSGQEDRCGTNARKVFFSLHQAVSVMRRELQSPVRMNKTCTETQQVLRAPGPEGTRESMQRRGLATMSPLLPTLTCKPEMAFLPQLQHL